MNELAMVAEINGVTTLVMLLVNWLLRRTYHLETKGVLREIKTDVNSGKTADQNRIEQLSSAVLRLSTELAATKEAIRGKDIAEALKAESSK